MNAADIVPPPYAMPPHTTDILDKILDYTVTAANALQDVADTTQIPFLGSVCSLSLTIIPIVQVWHFWSEFRVDAKLGMQNTKVQKERCLRMVEKMHQLLCALAALCMDSESIRSPRMLNQIAQYAE
jgi:hypothetical protein